MSQTFPTSAANIGGDAVIAGNLKLGNATLSGSSTATSLVLPNSSGTNGQVLTTNGSGQLSWATANSSQWSDISGGISYAQNATVGGQINAASASISGTTTTNSLVSNSYGGNVTLSGSLTANGSVDIANTFSMANTDNFSKIIDIDTFKAGMGSAASLNPYVFSIACTDDLIVAGLGINGGTAVTTPMVWILDSAGNNTWTGVSFGTTYLSTVDIIQISPNGQNIVFVGFYRNNDNSSAFCKVVASWNRGQSWTVLNDDNRIYFWAYSLSVDDDGNISYNWVNGGTNIYWRSLLESRNYSTGNTAAVLFTSTEVLIMSQENPARIRKANKATLLATANSSTATNLLTTISITFTGYQYDATQGKPTITYDGKYMVVGLRNTSTGNVQLITSADFQKNWYYTPLIEFFAGNNAVVNLPTWNRNGIAGVSTWSVAPNGVYNYNWINSSFPYGSTSVGAPLSISHYGIGVLASFDYGQTWNLVNSLPATKMVIAISQSGKRQIAAYSPEINGSTAYTAGSAAKWPIFSNTSASSGNLWSLRVRGDALLEGRVVSSLYSNVSDERMKEEIKDFVSGGLTKLDDIKCKTYTYIDRLLDKNTERVSGFLAQDLKEVLPECVNELGGFLPNIYQDCLMSLMEDTKDEYVLGLQGDYKDSRFNAVNAIGKDMKIMYTDGNFITAEIKEVKDKRTIRVKLKEQLLNLLPTSMFCYGSWADDLLTIDRTRMIPTMIVAIKELKLMVDQQKNKIEELEKRITV